MNKKKFCFDYFTLSERICKAYILYRLKIEYYKKKKLLWCRFLGCQFLKLSQVCQDFIKIFFFRKVLELTWLKKVKNSVQRFFYKISKSPPSDLSVPLFLLRELLAPGDQWKGYAIKMYKNLFFEFEESYTS